MKARWAAVHRKHYPKCVQLGAPHSPLVFGIKTQLMRGAKLHRALGII